jgi:hypothetical protein
MIATIIKASTIRFERRAPQMKRRTEALASVMRFLRSAGINPGSAAWLLPAASRIRNYNLPAT